VNLRIHRVGIHQEKPSGEMDGLILWGREGNLPETRDGGKDRVDAALVRSIQEIGWGPTVMCWGAHCRLRESAAQKKKAGRHTK